MKISFSDGSTGQIEIRHKLCSGEQRIVKRLLEGKQQYIKIIAALKTLGELSEGAKQPDVIRWLENELRKIKGRITIFCKQPVKTEICFTYNGQTFTSHSSISKIDAKMGLYSRKTGREAAIRNLLRDLGISNIDKNKRKELADQLIK